MAAVTDFRSSTGKMNHLRRCRYWFPWTCSVGKSGFESDFCLSSGSSKDLTAVCLCVQRFMAVWGVIRVYWVCVCIQDVYCTARHPLKRYTNRFIHHKPVQRHKNVGTGLCRFYAYVFRILVVYVGINPKIGICYTGPIKCVCVQDFVSELGYRVGYTASYVV